MNTPITNQEAWRLFKKPTASFRIPPDDAELYIKKSPKFWDLLWRRGEEMVYSTSRLSP